MLKLKFRNRVINNDKAINLISLVKEYMIACIIHLNKTNMTKIHRI